MKLSLMTFPMIAERMAGTLDAKQLCVLARDAGMEELDIMEFELGLYGVTELREAMAAEKLNCGCLISMVPFYTEPDAAVERLQKALEVARSFAAPVLMIVPGGAEEKETCEQRSRQEMLDQTVDFFRRAVELAEPLGIRIGLENTPQYWKPLASAEDCQYVLDQVKGLGLIFDTANMKVADPADDPLAFWELLKDRVIRVHLKDVVIGPFEDGEPCADGQTMRLVPTGSGIIPMRPLLAALRQDGYAGTLTLEYASGGASGDGHTVMLNRHTGFIRSVLADARPLPPCGIIPGLDEPVSRIFFGTAIMPMLMGQDVDSLLDGIYAMGIRAFDCARGYGAAEKSLGSWVRRRNNRERVVLLTKCGNVTKDGVKVNREVILSELETSLQTMQTDYIDIFLLHRDDPDTPVEEIIDCLNRCKQAGKIRTFGVSNWTHQRIAQANAYAVSHSLEGFSVSSPNFGLAEQVEDPWGGGCVTISGEANRDTRQWYADCQMPVLAYSSLGRGFFSGKFRSGDMDAARRLLDPFAVKGYLHPVNMERLARAEALAEQKRCTVSQIAMRYIFSYGLNLFAIVSTVNPDRMTENISAALHPLTPEEVSWLESGH